MLPTTKEVGMAKRSFWPTWGEFIAFVLWSNIVVGCLQLAVGITEAGTVCLIFGTLGLLIRFLIRSYIKVYKEHYSKEARAIKNDIHNNKG